MNEEQLIEFVNWLPSVVPEFKDATPDQIVQALNQMSESDEGQQILSQLINTFQQAKQSADSQMFKKGGKMAAFVSKYGKGGEMCCKKKAILQGGMVNKVFEDKNNKIQKAFWGKKINKKYLNSDDFVGVSSYEDYNNVNPVGQPATLDRNVYKNATLDSYQDATRSNDEDFKRLIINPGTEKADTLYQFFPKDIEMNANPFVVVSRSDPEAVAKYKDLLDQFDNTADNYKHMEKKNEFYRKNGGELATNTSANTLSNLGLLPKAQNGLSIQPQVKPSSIRGWFWKPTYQPRVDASGYEGDTEWTGERATYYKPNGDLIQILTKNYKPGNGAITERTIRNPFTPIADTTTVVSNQYGNRKVPTGQFNEVFRRNFDKKSK